MTIELALIGVALLVLVFLSTIESAYESLSEVTLRVMAAEHDEEPRGAFFKELLDHRQRFELMLVLGTQLSIVAIATLLLDVCYSAAIPYPVVGTLLVTLSVVILFRQLVPRMLAQNRPEEVLWGLLPYFRAFYRFFSIPVVPVSNLLIRLRKPEPESIDDEEEEEEAEIQAYIDVGEEEGIIEEAEGELIQSIVEFSDKRVGEVMRPRPQMLAIEASETLADARRLILESRHSRIPVYRGEIDNVEGILHVRDLLAFIEPEQASKPVTTCMRPAYFVPESKPIRDLLEEMQKAKVQMAMVIDEYGGVAGLVTVEDIVEEIVGEIEDEDRAPVDDKEIVKAQDGSYLVDGSAEIRKVELLFDKEIEADDFTTVAGLIINQLGHVPVAGEKLQFKGLEFAVTEADSRRVNKVSVRSVTGGNSDGADAARTPSGTNSDLTP